MSSTTSKQGSLGIMDFVSRYQEYEIQRDQTQNFIRDLMVYAEHVESTFRHENALLRQEVRDIRLDLEDAIKSRRDLQARLRDDEARLEFTQQENDNLKNRNPYIMVLMDGDGLIFKEEYIKQGLEGGKKAANAFRQAVAEQCRVADEIEIVAKIVANLSGLSKAMKRDGSVDSENDLREFFQGFTQAKASFEFIDVGYGKERADSKIREITRWNLRNHNCKQIVMGISHDAGYAPFLDDLVSDDNTRRRITILEGYPTVRELEATGANIIGMRDIFRGVKLVNRTATAPNAATSPTSTPSIVSATPTPAPAPGGFSYATVTSKASPPPQITLPIPLKTPVSTGRVPKPQPPPWNPGPRGLDTPIPLNQMVLENIKKRKDNNKLCNNHFLRGPCTKGSDCTFEHKYNPNKDELNAIAFLARLNPCTNGQDCDVENCIYGHHCPSVINAICTHPYCKFRTEEHPPGTKFKYPRSPDY